MAVSPIGPKRIPTVNHALSAAEVALTILCVFLGAGVTLVDSKNELRYFGASFFGAVWASTVIPIHFVNAGFFGRSVLHRYKEWAGSRSYVIQFLLLAWTMFVLSAYAVTTFALLTSETDLSVPKTDDVTAGMVFIVLTLMAFGVYAIMGLPLLIAAFVTLRPGKGSGSHDVIPKKCDSSS